MSSNHFMSYDLKYLLLKKPFPEIRKEVCLTFLAGRKELKVPDIKACIRIKTQRGLESVFFGPKMHFS